MAAASTMGWMNWLSIVALGTGIVALAVSLGVPGPVGPVGTQGPPGTDGPQGTPGISGYEIVDSIYTVSPGSHDLDVFCPTGKRVLGGGASDPPGTSGLIILQSFPIVSGGFGWGVRVAISSGPNEVHVWAICAVVT